MHFKYLAATAFTVAVTAAPTADQPGVALEAKRDAYNAGYGDDKNTWGSGSNWVDHANRPSNYGGQADGYKAKREANKQDYGHQKQDWNHGKNNGQG
ncbi:hypothetical protein TI39_contig423g00002 [Zymoseptoria brevis]|uniref:Uncharacterized protein n=1 Tax=Zymoseptoria brevis TaxID=1047168 RepID=A0A0F4GMF5_9PEZI|nr:hypothetical protein TI39_contig423g00002 [Zymoseptoria brevis]